MAYQSKIADVDYKYLKVLFANLLHVVIHTENDNILWHTRVNWREFGRIWIGLDEEIYCIFSMIYMYYRIRYKRLLEHSCGSHGIVPLRFPFKKTSLRSIVDWELPAVAPSDVCGGRSHTTLGCSQPVTNVVGVLELCWACLMGALPFCPPRLSSLQLEVLSTQLIFLRYHNCSRSEQSSSTPASSSWILHRHLPQEICGTSDLLLTGSKWTIIYNKIA